MAEQYAKRIVHVHCKDVRQVILERVRNRDASFLDAVLDGVFTVPGDGMVDYRTRADPVGGLGLLRLAGGRSRAGPRGGAFVRVCEQGLQHLQSVAGSLFHSS